MIPILRGMYYSLVLDGKVKQAINQIKQNSTKNNSEFF